METFLVSFAAIVKQLESQTFIGSIFTLHTYFSRATASKTRPSPELRP
jgi:hypothetical protein